MPAKKRVSKHVWIDPDDAPQWTKEQFDRAEIAVGGKVVRPAQGTLMRPRGRPKLDFGLFMRRERVHFPFGSRYGAEFLYCLGSAGT